MPTETLYRYNITETPNDTVEANRLYSEVRSSAIVTALDHIDLDSTYCDVWFKDELSTDDETTLSGIIVSHTGETYYTGPPVMSDGRPLIRADTRPLGTQTYFTCVGDTDSEIGAGNTLSWDFSNTEKEFNIDSIENSPTVASGYRAQRLDVKFIDDIYLKDGALYFTDAPFGSNLSMYITVPSGNYYPNASGTYPASALGLSGDQMYAYATSDVLYAAYVMKHHMVGDCHMGDELNAEGAQVDGIPAGWYITGIVMSPEDTCDYFKGFGSLELYRSHTIVLPGGALGGGE